MRHSLWKRLTATWRPRPPLLPNHKSSASLAPVTANPVRATFTPAPRPDGARVSFAPVVFKRDEEEDVD